MTETIHVLPHERRDALHDDRDLREPGGVVDPHGTRWPLLGPLFEAGGSVDVNILGDAPDALVEAIKDFHPTMYKLLASAELPSTAP